MQTKIIDGKKIRDELLQEIKNDVEKLPFVPVFCDILVGDDPVSASYVRIKAKTAESVGIKFRTAEFPTSVTTEELITEIEALNRVPHMCGIIIQLPLPSHIDTPRVLDAIEPSVDVDCLHSLSRKKFYENTPTYLYPTARSCVYLIEKYISVLKDTHVVVVGQGVLVGKPVAHMLRSLGANVSVVDSTTENPHDILRSAQVVVSATGKGKYITKDMLTSGVMVIDAGTSEEGGSIVGDVDFEDVLPIVSFITPTPGGVGPVTVAMLLSNVVLSAQKRNESR